MEELYQRVWERAFTGKLAKVIILPILNTEAADAAEYATAVARAAVMSFDHAKMTEAIVAANKVAP